MKRVVFLRIDSSFNLKYPPPRDIIIPFDIAQTISLLPRENFDFLIIDAWVEDFNIIQLVKKIIKAKPAILAINADGAVSKVAIKIFRKVKEKRNNIFNIAFGSYATFLSESFLFEKSPVDVCILGEAEKTLAGLISDSLNYKKIPGVAYLERKTKRLKKTASRKPMENLDSLPFLAHKYFLKTNHYRALFPTKIRPGRIKWGFLLSSRGCPYHCNFCSPSIRNSWGKIFRARSAKLVVDEIQYLTKNFGVNAIDFEDDVFTFDLNRAEKICEEIIRRIQISFAIQTRVDKLNLKLLRKLKRAGCTSITLGIESGNEEILRLTRKGITKNQIKKIVKQIHAVGIPTRLNFIIGYPGESLKQANETLKFAKELNPLYVHFHYCTLYPGTELYQTIKEKKWSLDKLSHFSSNTPNLSEIPNEKYRKLLKKFYKSYYLSSDYLIKHLPFHCLNFIFKPGEYFALFKEVVGFLFFSKNYLD